MESAAYSAEMKQEATTKHLVEVRKYDNSRALERDAEERLSDGQRLQVSSAQRAISVLVAHSWALNPAHVRSPTPLSARDALACGHYCRGV